MMGDVLAARPKHVPPELVVDFDFTNPPGMDEGDDVCQAWSRLHAGADIFWTPRYGGHWVLTRAGDIRAAQKDFEHFSHREFTLPRGSHVIRFAPIEFDPPEHGGYRTAINPGFSRDAVARLEPRIREVAAETVEQLQPRGRCEFVADFAGVLPSVVFLGMMDLPLSKRETFLTWVRAYVDAPTPETKRAALAVIIDYLASVVAERKKARGGDLISHLLNIRDEGKRLQNPDDIMGTLLTLYAGGLDTVANMLSFTARFLARNPSHRRHLIQEPETIPRAAEEFIRRHGLSNTIRIITTDISFNGVQFKEGDAVMVPILMSSLDPRRYDNPLAINFDRGVGEYEHDTFGNGPHRCPGALLARAELRIFLQEWLQRIPHFEIDPNDTDITTAGTINSVPHLPLVWAA